MAGGEIGDSAVLARLVPLGLAAFIGKNNRIRRGALQIADVLEDDGWSFLLMLLIVAPGIGGELERREQKNGRRYGYALITAGDIRAVLDEAGRTAFCVIAAPLPDDPAHALVQTARAYRGEEIRSLREKLLAKFGEVKFA